MSEHETQSAIIDLITRRGGVAIRVNSGGSMSKRGGHIRLAKKGTSDIIACYLGNFLAIEVKDTGEEPTDDQREFLNCVMRAGGVALIAYSVDEMNDILDVDDSRRLT